MSHDESFDAETHVQDARASLPGSGARPQPHIEWTDAAGRHALALAERTVVGSAQRANVVVADPTLSRLHAELEPRDDGLWITDLGSRNGTFVEEVMVTSARVPEGGRVRLGSTVFTVRYAPRGAQVELWTTDRFGPLLGRSAAMRELFTRLARIAASDATVMIHGETGTGKELVAWALHEASPRAQGPFVVVDCGSLPENLLEAELFGHAKGAFTGATAARAGAIESAHGGTVFLDEIGEVPLAMQPKLLRAIESRTVRRLGENAYRKVDVRFVSATHRDLRAMVNTGAFREDLYFRLAVVPVTVPPLRARAEDIPMLIEHFIPEGVRAPISAELLDELALRPWPGNVRELRNFVDRVLALGEHEALSMVPARSDRGAPPGGPVDPSAMPPVPLDAPFKTIRERWVSYLEREYIRGLLARHRGNISAVASAAGLARTYVHRLVRKYDL